MSPYYVLPDGPEWDRGPALLPASLEEHIRYTIRAVLLTQKGERPFNSELGSELTDLFFRPLTPNLRQEIRTKIQSAVERGEPRVNLLEVTVGSDRNDKNRILLEMRYRVKLTDKVEQLKMVLQP